MNKVLIPLTAHVHKGKNYTKREKVQIRIKKNKRQGKEKKRPNLECFGQF